MNNEITPLVSISCLVYNHAPYLRQCLDGFLMQKTDFPFEVLIHEDASTDGSADIIREYEQRYPTIIKPIYETENQWVKGRRGSVTFNFPRAKGKYIALCEGDDYWTDPLKLQKQVDFLESHSDYSLCVHQFNILHQDTGITEGPKPFMLDEPFIFDLDYYISGLWITQPLSTIFRNVPQITQSFSQCMNSKDVSMFYEILKEGKGCLLNQTMGVYRIHSGGIWNGVIWPDRYATEIEARMGLYYFEQTEKAARYLYNYLLRADYLGIRFMMHYRALHNKSLRIIQKHFGIKASLNLRFRAINVFHRKH